MAGLRIKQKAKLHNKFYLVLTDARTGKIKQEAYAYNIILDKGIDTLIEIFFRTAWESWQTQTRLFSNGSGYYHKEGPWNRINLGKGTGTLDPTRETMFNYLDRKVSNNHANGRDNTEMTAFNTRVATWDENELQNENITEVGLGDGTGTFTYYLATHALIEDSEGNPITVPKGEHDILTVYATVYMEIQTPTYDNFALLNDNPLLRVVYGGDGGGHNIGGTATRWWIHTGRNDDDPDRGDAVVKTQITETARTASIVGHSIEFGPERLAADISNHNDGIREIGIRFGNADMGYWNFWRSAMPIPDVWEGYNIEGEELGTGDGTQTEFETQWTDIVEDSETIYVDGNVQTKDTDYTINYVTGVITFNTAPGDGSAVTANYSIEYIPKDENHVLDVSFKIEFADGNA